MDVCPELVVKVPASTSKVADIVEGESSPLGRGSSENKGGLSWRWWFETTPSPNVDVLPLKRKELRETNPCVFASTFRLPLSYIAPYFLVTTLCCGSSCILSYR